MDAQTDRAAIAAVLDAVRRGHRERDAAAIAARFAPDAVIYDLAPPLGHRLDVTTLAGWLDSWEGPVEVEFRAPVVAVGGDVAFCHGLARVRATARSDREHVEWWQRLTVCLRRLGGEWKIVHEHASVPFYMDGSFRAAIDLTP